MASDKVIVDGMYKLTNVTTYELDTKVVNIVGDTLKSGFDVSGCGTIFDVAESCAQISIKGITFNNSSDKIAILFRKNYSASRMDFVEMENCTTLGNVSPFRFQQDITVNPNEVNLGVDVIRIVNNTVRNCRASFAIFSDVSFDLLEVSGNIIRNFDYSFIAAGTTNESAYNKEITLSKRMALIRDNDVYCACVTSEDDLQNAWWGNEQNGSYYVFVLLECDRIRYSNNRIEGMKSKNVDAALYDAYLSCQDVVYEHNIWKNNCIFNSNALNNTVMKAKGSVLNGKRKYYNNS